LQPYEVKDLIRLGKNNDGGYLVSENDIKNTKNLISLGVSFDISFEKDFKRYNKYLKILCYDGSVGFKYYKKNLKLKIKSFLKKPSLQKFNKFKLRVVDFITFIQFFSFSKDCVHIEKFIDSGLSKDFHKNFYKFYGYEAEYTSIEELFTDIANDTFFSIDIEGSEYGVLDKIVDSQSKLSGLVVELHNANFNKSRIENFIKNFELKLIHLHINNYAEIQSEFPTVIELTFSRFAELTNNMVEILPNKLDQKNNEYGPNYSTTFKVE